MKLIIYLIFGFFSFISQAQIVEVSSFDELDWDNLGKNRNATFCIVDGKTGELVELRHYKNGKKHGMFFAAVKLLDDKISYTESNFRRGVLHGYYKGLGASGCYKNGEKHGVWEYSNDSGNYEKITYKMGAKHGAYLKKDGVITTEGSFKNDEKVGVWKNYRNDGEILMLQHYKNGEIVP